MDVKIDKGAVRVTNTVTTAENTVSTGSTGVTVIGVATRILLRPANPNTKCVNIKNIGLNDVWFGFNNLIDNTNSQVLTRYSTVIIRNFIGDIYVYSLLGTTVDWGVLELP